MTSPDAFEAAAHVREQILDRATEWLDRFVLALRAEGHTDEAIVRVVNRILTGCPDPDEMIRPADAARLLDPSGQHGGPACH